MPVPCFGGIDVRHDVRHDVRRPGDPVVYRSLDSRIAGAFVLENVLTESECDEVCGSELY